MAVALTEVVPANVRTAGFSLAYSLAIALFGGFTPAISTALIEFTGNKAAPGSWMFFSAVRFAHYAFPLSTRRGGQARRDIGESRSMTTDPILRAWHPKNLLGGAVSPNYDTAPGHAIGRQRRPSRARSWSASFGPSLPAL
jgi:hypothetical protein